MGCALLICWYRDVVHRCAEQQGREAAGEGLQNRADDAAHGRYEPGTGSVDRGMPDTVGGVSGHLALDVDNRRGTIAGMSRSSALEFSFFLSIPTMVVATAYDLLKSLVGKNANPIGVAGIDAHGWIVLAIGFVVSFIVAYGTVAWFMAYVRKRGFGPFAVYRIVLGILVLYSAGRFG